jgi:8-oxo-dGTP pyrophosphatase MutT (NUDIX family)
MPEYAVPKEASTVMIMRPAIDIKDGPFEVLMVKRHPASVFAPDCYVFPGGCIDEEDCSDEAVSFCRGLDRQKAFRILGGMSTEAMALGAWVAAVRETYEEADIFLSANPPDPDTLTVRRRQLLDGKERFTNILKREKLS